MESVLPLLGIALLAGIIIGSMRWIPAPMQKPTQEEKCKAEARDLFVRPQFTFSNLPRNQKIAAIAAAVQMTQDVAVSEKQIGEWVKDL